jgi:excinuclease ABC subunit C
MLHLVQTIRDEAHRFAVTFHRNRRNTSRMKSELHEVRGVGPKTVEKLLRVFGSLERVKSSSDADLAKAVGPKAAKRVRDHFGGDLTIDSLPLVQIDASLAMEQPQSERIG